jgi:hypothetical protein
MPKSLAVIHCSAARSAAILISAQNAPDFYSILSNRMLRAGLPRLSSGT